MVVARCYYYIIIIIIIIALILPHALYVHKYNVMREKL